MNERELFNLTDKGIELIHRGYGIELTWSEKVGLRYYLQTFEKLEDKGILKESALAATLHLFMLDYFGLDNVALAGRISDSHEIKEFGMHFLELKYYEADERFREHCRRNVELWRDERNLI